MFSFFFRSIQKALTRSLPLQTLPPLTSRGTPPPSPSPPRGLNPRSLSLREKKEEEEIRTQKQKQTELHTKCSTIRLSVKIIPSFKFILVVYTISPTLYKISIIALVIIHTFTHSLIHTIIHLPTRIINNEVIYVLIKSKFSYNRTGKSLRSYEAKKGRIILCHAVSATLGLSCGQLCR